LVKSAVADSNFMLQRKFLISENLLKKVLEKKKEELK